MFEKASRFKLRFDTTQGQLDVEDLWDLPLTSGNRANLDDIARGLSKQVKEAETESFIVKPAKANEITLLKFDIIKHVIEIRLAENEAAATARANKERKQKILAIIANKQDEQLATSSIEDLQKLAEAL